MSSTDKTTIYYDGACHLCSREIDVYRQKNHAERLRFINIAAKDFDPQKEKLDPVEINRFMHVRCPDGKIVTGIDAFAQIWSELGVFRLGRFLVNKEPSRSLLKIGYRFFAVLRPMLPKKKCVDDTCELK